MPNYDRNVPSNWKPVAGLADRKPRMAFSDRLFYWLVALGGLALTAVGVGLIWLFGTTRWGGILIAIGICVLFFGGPDQAARNGYRS